MEADNKTIGIRDYPINERPRERLENLGESALTNAELLAILLRVGVEGRNAVDLARDVLNQFGGLRGLHAAQFQDLCAVKGLGKAKAAQIKAAIELGYRLSREEDTPAVYLSKPADVHALMAHRLAAKLQEELWVLALNTRNRLVWEQRLYIGTLNHSSVRLAEVFEVPLRQRASAIILVHNHPSGDPQPSDEDIYFTEELVKAGRLLDVGVLDHIVIAEGGYCSIRQMGRVSFNLPQPRSWH
ncbi:MAG: repair protein RadC [Chloroflexota bacterium]|nr:repair protein RadC [Chloroflexota bacterium]